MADNINVKHDPTIDTVPVATDEQGTVHVPIYEDLYLAIPQGKIATLGSVNKFGQAPDFDTGDGEVTIWDGADDGGLDEMQYNYSSGADIDAISSSDNTDTQTYEVQGLDTNGELSVQDVVATGQTLAPLTTPLSRVFRIKNKGATDNAGTIYVFEDTDGVDAGGVPVTSADVRAIIQPGNNQTLMSIYTVPTGKTAYMTGWNATLSSGSRSAEYTLRLKARPSGGVFQIKDHATIDDSVSVQFEKKYKPYKKFSAGTDIEVRVQLITGAVTAAGFSAGFDLILVDD